ncbi:MAG: 5-histidylcysteine sulfoxide synthase [Deltaproteobacteria bacterium]|nr:5-histidylcysteine sulfoxide synthase [Deltaproteobacteria bacterium]MBN2673499.1 5-histidylcysteine sulfoxide synthase [Deltaproteobacteria bacterium]
MTDVSNSFHKITQNIRLRDGSVARKRAEIRQYFIDTFELYERLFLTLASDEVFYKRPQPLRHPLIFYFGHTAVFFVNKLMLAKVFTRRVDAAMESIFAIGVDEMSWDDLNTDHYHWPTADEVRAYRGKVRQAVLAAIDSVDFSLPIDWDSAMWPILMGIEHERIHLETSSVLIRQLALADVREYPLFDPCTETGPAPENALVPIAGKTVSLGNRRSSELYGWDNEYGHMTVDVTDFQVSKYLVSNGEFLAFVEDGGYENEQWWDTEGAAWRNYHQAMMPEFWNKTDAGYRLRLMTREVPLPLDWPVEVCYLEAKAFCNWLAAKTATSVRMPDEAEYRLMLQTAGVAHEHVDDPIDANWNLEHWAGPCPVNRFAHGPVYDAVGNVWQWNETPIYGFNGFAVHPLYDDFSTPTFDNRHNLMKGGSWISTGNEIALHSRYAFRRHFYQHAGFRYVVSERAVKKEFNVYETDASVAMYLEFQYGESYFQVANFAKKIAEIALAALDDKPRKRALDIGCATGRLAFELAPHFSHVDGLDFSARFIRQAAALQQTGTTRYELPMEGDLVQYKEIILSELGISTDSGNVSFMQQDACNLKPQYTDYDLVVAANLVDRLNDPRRFLAEMAGRVVPGGVLVIASPYTWLEEFTRRENWLGGYKKDGEPVSGIDGLMDALGEHFELLFAPLDVPFVIRETARKFQHTISQVTVWGRK